MGHVGSTLNRRGWFAGARPSAVAGALACAVAFLFSVSAGPLAQAQNYSVVYSFQCGTQFGGPGDGQYPEGDLIADSAGNLYGTTNRGGTYAEEPGTGAGTVFEISTAGVETVLHSFGAPGDGFWPTSALVRDSNGNLYGTTQVGGALSNDSGTVFEVSASGVETVLYSFTGGKDEGRPDGKLLLDSAGNLYGATLGPFSGEYGTIFKLAPDGKITELYTFKGPPTDGAGPTGVIRDSFGDLYGATEGGGVDNLGTVFELSKDRVETVLYSFGTSGSGGFGDASTPLAGLVRDEAGNLYGTTYEGGGLGGPDTFCDLIGGYYCGTVFKVTPTGEETILHAFSGGTDGGIPLSDLILDPNGNLYGTASMGGLFGNGVVFETTAAGDEKVLYNFQGWPDDGSNPYSGLLRVGNYFYGTTYYGGTYDCGTVYKVAP
jgi:uncharacterized repeat protein (TIGR03803 family)